MTDPERRESMGLFPYVFLKSRCRRGISESLRISNTFENFLRNFVRPFENEVLPDVVHFKVDSQCSWISSQV